MRTTANLGPSSAEKAPDAVGRAAGARAVRPPDGRVPGAGDAAGVAALHRLAGNRAVAGLLNVQRKVENFHAVPAPVPIPAPVPELLKKIEKIREADWPFVETPADVGTKIQNAAAVSKEKAFTVSTSVTAEISNPYGKMSERGNNSAHVGHAGRDEFLIRTGSVQAIEGGHLIGRKFWGTKANANNTPVADTPVADTPVADTPVADKPTADTPVADKPTADKPTAGKASAGKASKWSIYEGLEARFVAADAKPETDTDTNLVPMSRTFNVTKGFHDFESKVEDELKTADKANLPLVLKVSLAVVRESGYTVGIRDIARAFGLVLKRGEDGKKAKSDQAFTFVPLIPSRIDAMYTKRTPAPTIQSDAARQSTSTGSTSSYTGKRTRQDDDDGTNPKRSKTDATVPARRDDGDPAALTPPNTTSAAPTPPPSTTSAEQTPPRDVDFTKQTTLRESTIFDTSSRITDVKEFRRHLRRTALWNRLNADVREKIKALT